MPTLADQLTALGADPTQARYAAEQLAAGDARPLLLMLLGRGLLADVLPEHVGPGAPAWIERWRRLAETGFPFIDVPALNRLLAAGADATDLTDVIRSAQLLTAYNIAALIDDPGVAVPAGLDVPDGVVDWRLVHRAENGAAEEVGALHEEIMEWDPTGRGGAPRSLDLRRLQNLPDEVRAELVPLIREREYGKAALLWKRHVGGALSACLAVVERLRRELAGTAAFG
jgi:hypothetical protein